MDRLKGKTALITGSDSGIGEAVFARAVSRHFHEDESDDELRLWAPAIGRRHSLEWRSTEPSLPDMGGCWEG
jgi:NAD(P)-dependent dehydrogenase (short-subunit alcohol dehydrogenase family)